MGINPEVRNAPAIRGDITGLAIRVSIALDHISEALVALQKGEQVDDIVEKIKELSQECDEIFERLSGWTKD